MKEKKTYEFPLKITVYADAYITSDSQKKAVRLLNEIDPEEILHFIKNTDEDREFDVKILDCTEYALGNIAEEYILADTEDYEDYDEDL